MMAPSLTLEKEQLADTNKALKKEWLLTNGLGGYASSTILGVNTRKYHGLLVAALNPPGNRTVCLEKIDEEIAVSGSVYRLGANEFSDVFYPEGFQFINSVTIAPSMNFYYVTEQISVNKKIFIPNLTNSVTVIYKIQNQNNSKSTIRITPLLNWRHFHSVTNKANNSMRFVQTHEMKKVQLDFQSPNASLKIETSNGRFQERPNWIERLFYREEKARGESAIDDCYEPGFFEIAVEPKSTVEFAVVAEAVEDPNEALNKDEVDLNSAKRLLVKEIRRQTALVEDSSAINSNLLVSDWIPWILLAANSFVVSGLTDCRSIIAGYHWFESWGRDSFVSLPGLLLTRNRFEEARKVFVQFSTVCHQGLIPNFVSDQSSNPSCNTVDATLWYIYSVLQYLKYTADFEFIRDNLWSILKEILQHHLRGTAFNIHVDSDGLLAHGERLTWMDAEAGGISITPRGGKAVEIQALWYNALRVMQLLASRFNEKNLAESFLVLADKAKSSFNAKFWNTERHYLYDVVTEHGNDDSLRPNQIIVPALDFNLLDQSKNIEIVAAVQSSLLTPCGLRTLDPRDSRYKGIYSGDRSSRDQAYHNGTVWPWLMGPFTTAFLKSKHYSIENCRFACKNFVEPLFRRQIQQAGLGTINEIFDGDPPHFSRGCISQAWSVAEPLRACIEDCLQIRPKFENDVLCFKI
jgi:predicted glycogen debranching enzyme